MKSLNFNRESWHYKVATELGGLPKWFETTNICEYTRAVLKGAIMMMIVAAAAFGLLYWVAITIAWWIAVLYTGVFIDASGPIVLSGIVIIFTVVSAVTILINRFQGWLYARQCKKHRECDYAPPKPDSFIKKAYRSWKDKTCVRITLN